MKFKKEQGEMHVQRRGEGGKRKQNKKEKKRNSVNCGRVPAVILYILRTMINY